MRQNGDIVSHIMKPDLTRQRITDAFNRLIRKAEFESLTVNDIVREAGISRATFYRHFRDKYDVMNFNYFCLLNASIENPNVSTMEDLFVLLLTAGASGFYDLRSLFNTTGTNSLHEYISSYSRDAAVNLYETGNVFAQGERIRTLSETEKMQLAMFCHGAAFLFEEWVKGAVPLSASQTASAMYELLPLSFHGPLSKRKES